MERPVARAAEVEAPGGVEQRGELGPPIALALRRDRGELLADVLGGDHRTTPSSASSRRLTSTPGVAVAADAVRGDDAMARDDEREAVRGAERARGARGARATGERRELAVRDDLAARHRAERIGERALERRRPVEVDGDVLEGRRRRPRESA